MSGAFAAMGKGSRLVVRSPKLLLWSWLVNLLLAVPLAAVVSAAIHESVRDSLVAQNLERGFDDAWFAQLEGDQEGIVATLQPTLIGVGGFLQNLDAWWAGRLFAADDALVAAGVAYALSSAFVVGGAIAQFGRGGGRVSFRRFAADGGRTWSRFVRLAVVTGVLYYGIFRLGRWLFPRLEEATRDVTTEGRVLLVYLGGALVIVVLLAMVRAVSDYAKIVIVTQDVPSVLGALVRGARFVARHFLRVALLDLVGLIAGAAWLVVVSLFPTGVTAASWAAVAGIVVLGQVAIAGRIALRLIFYASETELYRGRGTPRRP